jgi:hypothetical protein
MRFHLPAYLIADLRGDYRFGMVFTFRNAPVRDEPFSLLNESQRTAVRHYLELRATDPNYDFERPEIERCIAGYWAA